MRGESEPHTRDEQRAVVVRRIRAAYRMLIGDGTDLVRRNARIEVLGLCDMNWFVRNGVHFGLFMGAIAGQGNKEQQAEWLSKTMMFQVFGCFAMTEIGHGSNLRALETVAEFDPQTHEFVINSPTDTSTKFWIGAAGQTATHTVCFAKLLIDGENKGVHTFIVPLRDEETHHVLPGIHIGDCGAKMSLDGIDNGWIQFDHVRVPRENMLARFAQVTPEGRYIKPPSEQAAYGALIGSRGALAEMAVNVQKKALTIVVRYAAIRAQGSLLPPEAETARSGSGSASVSDPTAPVPEITLLDYQSHQHKLMPLLAAAYGWHTVCAELRKIIAHLEEGLDVGDVSILKHVHGTLAGLKAFSTWHAMDMIEVCRQACGGHGYSDYNGLAPLVKEFAVYCTFEGDNTVMAQQTSRYLVSVVRDLTSSSSSSNNNKKKRLDGWLGYLQRVHDRPHYYTHWGVSSVGDLRDQDLQVQAIDHIAAHAVLDACRHFLELERELGWTKAWNRCQVALIDAARAHIAHTVCESFIQAVHAPRLAPETAPEDQIPAYEALRPVLTNMCELHVLGYLREQAASMLEFAFATPRQLTWVRDRVLELCGMVRQDAVALVDAFNYSDEMLCSCIGAADGDAYHRLLERVKATPETGRPTPYFESEIAPLLRGEDLQTTAIDDDDDDA